MSVYGLWGRPMAVDWNRYRKIVDDAMKKWGRPITLIKDAGPLDPSDPLGMPGVETVVSNIQAVFVNPVGNTSLGIARYISPGLLENSEQIALILPSRVHDFKRFTRCTDGGAKWKISQVDELKPGPVPILLYIGLRQ